MKKYDFLILKETINLYGFILTMDTINQAISLLESHGYKVEAPYGDPTDEEIYERIRHENEKAGWTADWDKLIDEKYYILYSHRINRYTKECAISCRSLSETYTTKEIAEQMVDELNEGRFVRV